MDDNVTELFQDKGIEPLWLERDEFLAFFKNQPVTITKEQCVEAREILGWSVEALAFRSGASVKAIRAFESGHNPLREITRRALAYSLEKEGIVLFPGQKAMRGGNVRGCTDDPKLRDDYSLIE